MQISETIINRIKERAQKDFNADPYETHSILRLLEPDDLIEMLIPNKDIKMKVPSKISQRLSRDAYLHSLSESDCITSQDIIDIIKSNLQK